MSIQLNEKNIVKTSIVDSVLFVDDFSINIANCKNDVVVKNGQFKAEHDWLIDIDQHYSNKYISELNCEVLRILAENNLKSFTYRGNKVSILSLADALGIGKK